MKPKNSLDSEPFEFDLEPVDDSFIQLGSTRLECKFKLVKADGSDIKPLKNTAQKILKRSNAVNETWKVLAGDDLEFCAPITNSLASLFSSIEVFINDVPINLNSSKHVCYQAYFQNLLSYGSSRGYWKNYDTLTGLYMKDRAGQMDWRPERKNTEEPEKVKKEREEEEDLPLDGVEMQNIQMFTFEAEPATYNNDVNDALLSRYLYFYASAERTLTGPVPVDFFRANNHMPPNNKITLRFHRTSDEFMLIRHKDSQENFKVEIKDLTLHLRRINLHHQALKAVMPRQINNGFLSFHAPRTEIKTFTVPAGSRQHIEKIFNEGRGKPKHTLFAQVLQDAYMGDYNLNPFNFQHFGLDSVQFELNGEVYPFHKYTPNFEKGGNITRDYFSLFCNTGRRNSNKGSQISKYEFANGFTVYAEDFSPDWCNMAHIHKFPDNMDGALSLRLGWKNPTEKNITVITMNTFEQNIVIDTRSRAPSYADI